MLQKRIGTFFEHHSKPLKCIPNPNTESLGTRLHLDIGSLCSSWYKRVIESERLWRDRCVSSKCPLDPQKKIFHKGDIRPHTYRKARHTVFAGDALSCVMDCCVGNAREFSTQLHIRGYIICHLNTDASGQTEHRMLSLSPKTPSAPGSPAKTGANTR